MSQRNPLRQSFKYAHVRTVCPRVCETCFSHSVSDAVMPSFFSLAHPATDHRQRRAKRVCERDTSACVIYRQGLDLSHITSAFPQPNIHTSPHLGHIDIHAKPQHARTLTLWNCTDSRTQPDGRQTLCWPAQTCRHVDTRAVEGRKERWGRRGEGSDLLHLQLAGMPKPAGGIKAQHSAGFINALKRPVL